ncbi:hypothetical protein FKX85_17310 [Echinicola soli]|uniref:Uncharacterized protein n=1 Tax=Echinicola soli TaxID=2591634 RepID=A0A514CLK0_9BACT|nr:hypothetical protein [Echinicola soli]QDH80703.1 hypothetical protein FKX85_17310 [Echinicola soli]
MKKVNAFFLVIMLTIFSHAIFAQDFHPSDEFLMTTVPDALRRIDHSNLPADGYTNIYLTDRGGKVLKGFPVFIESYYDNAEVEEIILPWLKDVRKVIRLRIDHCPCYCDIEVYHWLLTHDGQWTALPVLTPPDYEVSLTYLAYIFPEEEPNVIELHEYQDEVILGEIEPTFRQIADQTIKTLTWDGRSIKEE